LQRRIDDFDVVHFHIDYLHFPVASRFSVPALTALHGRLDMPDLIPLFCGTDKHTTRYKIIIKKGFEGGK
jgi:hypothetical protein